jgi:protein TIF31
VAVIIFPFAAECAKTCIVSCTQFNILACVVLLQARPDILQVFQAAASAGGGSRGSLKAAAAAAALMGERENLPRSRGMDERGARAKADARKRAAARGVNVRMPNNLLPVNPDLLSIPTAGSGGKARADGSLGSSSKVGKEAKETETSPAPKEQVKTDVENTRSHAKPGNGSAIAEEKSKDRSAQEQAPLGLGVSLGSLESKKLKSLKKKAPSSKAVEL